MIGSCTYPMWAPRKDPETGAVTGSDCGDPATVAALRDDGRPWRLACHTHAGRYPGAVPIATVEEP